MRDTTGSGASIPLLLVLLCLPLAVHAQGLSEVQAYLASVNRLYRNLEYERALERVQRAKRLAHSVEDDVALAVYEGILLAEMRRTEESTAAFQSALFIRPEVKLPVKVSRKVEKHFETVRAQVKQELALLREKREEEQRQAAQREEEQRQAAKREEEQRQAEAARRQNALSPGSLGTNAPVPPPWTEVSSRAPQRSRVLIPAIAGGVLLALGGVSYGLSMSERAKLRGDDPNLSTRADAHASAVRGKTYQTVGLGLAGAGAVGLGVATGMYLLDTPTSPVTLGVSTDGSSAFVYGSWP
jgi:tetratricopeptide (TPR) repeat protein